MDNKISIIIPMYNVEKYITTMLDSIKKQNYENYEVILINDGSTDNTLDVVKEWIKENNEKRFLVFNKENSGVSDSRNIGIDKSNGIYITFFDSDDYIEKNYLCDAIAEIENKKLDVFISGFFSEILTENNCNNKKICYKNILYDNKKILYDGYLDLWENTMMYNIWNKIYIKSIIDKNKIKFKKQNYAEDVEFNKEYFKYVERCYCSDKCYYHYIRERDGAATNKFVEGFFEFREEEYLLYDRYFSSIGYDRKEYIEYISRRFIERTMGCCESIFEKNCNLNKKEKYLYVKNILNNNNVKEAIKNMKPQSKKIKIMLIPYKLRSANLEIILSKMISIVKCKFPATFNKLKNER